MTSQLRGQDENHLDVDLDDEPIITAVHLVEGPQAGPMEVKSEHTETQLLFPRNVEKRFKSNPPVHHIAYGSLRMMPLWKMLVLPLPLVIAMNVRPQMLQLILNLDVFRGCQMSCKMANFGLGERGQGLSLKREILQSSRYTYLTNPSAPVHLYVIVT